MLGGKDNENGEKTTIGLISKKATFTRAVNFFCIFHCRWFAWLQRETSRNFLVTRFMQKTSYVFLFPFFSLSLIFTLVAASISLFLTTATKFHVVPPTKSVSFVFSLSRSSCSFRWASLACPLLSLFLCLSQFLYFPNLWTWQLIQA